MAEEALRSWETPGLALVLVHRDRVVLAKGYGVRKIDEKAPITPDTLFPLASCTKPFTSILLAMLVDQGKVQWDDPVRRHLPWFRLADPLAGREATLRDLLCHRTGIGRHEFLWYRAPWGLEERIRKIGLVEPERSFRSGFGYQTILYGAAGLAGATAAGSSWESLIRERLQVPLGMKDSHPAFPADPPEDLASPHRRTRGGKIEPIARYPLEQADPAGSLHATARDLGRFLRFQLAEGVWQGKRLVSAKHLRETHAPQVILPRDDLSRLMNPLSLHVHYGLGWIEQDYRGKVLLQHGGVIDGFRAHLTLVPEARFAAAFLSNLDGGFMNLGLSNALVDLVLDAPPRDWNAYYLAIDRQEHQQTLRAEEAFLAARRPDAKPTLPLAAYLGRYEDPVYGICTVAEKGPALAWTWSGIRCRLEHHHEDTFQAIEGEGPAGQPLRFLLRDGSVVGLRVLGRTFRRLEK